MEEAGAVAANGRAANIAVVSKIDAHRMIGPYFVTLRKWSIRK
jgi:hypothetical protein